MWSSCRKYKCEKGTAKNSFYFAFGLESIIKLRKRKGDAGLNLDVCLKLISDDQIQSNLSNKQQSEVSES